jgi:hypothetical protein
LGQADSLKRADHSIGRNLANAQGMTPI